MNLQFQLAKDGSAVGVTQVGIPYPDASFTYTYSGSFAVSTITAVRTLVQGSGGTIYSSWFPVTDASPGTSVAVTGVSIGRDSATGNIDYAITGKASNYWSASGGTPCKQPSTFCQMNLEFQLASNGSSVGIDAAGIAYPSASFTHTFSGSIAEPSISAVRTLVEGGGSGTLYSAWHSVADISAKESAGGGNPSETNCQCSHADPVNTATGELYEPATDLVLPGSGPALQLTRTYSSVFASVNGPFGYGWSTDLSTHLTFPSSSLVDVSQENGSTIEFVKQSDGSYLAPPRVLATLAMNTSSGVYTFTRKARQVMHFSSNGSLLDVDDLHGSTVAFGRDGNGNVTSLTASGGRSITLTWGSNHVTKAADSAGRVVTYGYDSSGNLSSVTAVDSTVTAFGYNSRHFMTTLSKPGGGVTTNTFDSSNRVSSQTDPLGRVTSFAYNGLTTKTTSPDGSAQTETYNGGALASQTNGFGTSLVQTTSYTYDAANNVASVTDPLGHVTTMTYDTRGNALTKTDPLGHVTTMTYDALNDVTSVVDPLNRATSMAYNSAGDMTSLTTPEGHTSTWTLNSDGTVATSTDALGKSTSYTYDAAGRPLCVTDPDSRQTCRSYDGRGFVTSKTDAAGKVITISYDNAGRVLTVTDPNANTTTNTYDADGNLTSTTDGAGHTTSATYDAADQRTSSTDGRGKTIAYTYTTRGSVATVTDPNGHVTTNAYDALNRLTSTTDADNHLTSFGYDLAGHKTSTTLPSGGITSSTYDAAGRVATMTDARGKVTTDAYNDAGQLTSTTDPLGRVTSYSYTADGKLHVTTLPDTSTEISTYNADGARTSFTNADGDVTSYVYDDAGLLSSETQPGSMTTSYSYDTGGRIHTVTTPDGVVATRSYDDGGRLTGIDYPGTADDVSYTYFPDGTRHTMTDATGTTTYAYNADAAITSVQNGNGRSIGYGYDDASQLTSITYPGAKTVGYGYDNAGNTTSVTDWSSRTTTLTVTEDGLQNTRTDPSGVTETRSYNANDQLTDVATATSSATLSDYGYGYDDAGQLTSSTTADALHPTAATNNWGYTALGQLSTTGPTTGFATSSAGKITATPAGDAFSYNSKQELASATNTGNGTSTSYGYNGNGSRTNSVTTSSSAPTASIGYSYDARGNLASVTTGTTTVDYTSDGTGLRQSRTVGSTTQQFLWDPNHTIPLLLDDGTYSYIYATGTTPIAQIDDTTGTIEYLHNDNVGSVRTITDNTGAVVSTTDYSPYGAVTAHSGTSSSAFGYASAWTDPTTGTEYLRAREYDPQSGQFLQVDPAVNQTRQPYEYVAGDPLSASDPTGLCVGMDSTPQDRACTYNDFFWAGLGSSIGDEFHIAQAGFDDGATFGLASQFGWVDCSAKSSDLYWVEYGIGAVVMTAASMGTGALTGGATRAGLGLYDDVRSAETVSGSLRHYTTSENAEAISSEGVIQPGASGKTWLTPTEFNSGEDAKSFLALNKVPDGYFEIPEGRIGSPSAPSMVEPYNGQPGGGIEITTPDKINVDGLKFHTF